MNKKGFTLIELLAVVIVLAMIVTIAGMSIASSVNRAKKHANSQTVENLKDAAVTYAIDKKFFKVGGPSNCNGSAPNTGCNITLNELVNNGYFNDKGNKCAGVTNINIKLKKECNGNDCAKNYNVTVTGNCK